MLGAIIGDIVGSRFEQQNRKSKTFELFNSNCHITDDTIMTLAIAEACDNIINFDLIDLAARSEFRDVMVKWGKNYPSYEYGKGFLAWFENPVPYGSFGNGAIMRVSPIAWKFDNLDKVEKYAQLSAEVSHNYPSAIAGAVAIAGAIWTARKTKDKKQVKDYIESFGYDIPKIDIIRPTYEFDCSCDGTIPVAVAAYLESKNFEDAIRNAISVGGDSDTIAAVTGALAEAEYGIPEEFKKKARHYVGSNLYRIE